MTDGSTERITGPIAEPELKPERTTTAIGSALMQGVGDGED